MLKRHVWDCSAGNHQVVLEPFSSGPLVQSSSWLNLKPQNPKGCLTASSSCLSPGFVVRKGGSAGPSLRPTHHPPEVPLKLIVFTASFTPSCKSFYDMAQEHWAVRRAWGQNKSWNTEAWVPQLPGGGKTGMPSVLPWPAIGWLGDRSLPSVARAAPVCVHAC